MLQRPRFVCFCVWVFLAGSANAEPPKFQILFNGQSLDQWKGESGLWSVQDGAIVGQTTAENPIPSNTFLIYQDGDVADFEFRCKVRFEGNNSGVQYRSRSIPDKPFGLAGYQADLHPDQAYFGMMYGEQTGRGIIAQRGQKVVVDQDGKSQVIGQVGDQTQFVDNQWNDLRIVAVGNRLIHQINGITTLDLTDSHPDAATSGKLGLQLHAGPPMKVEFRNLLLRALSGDDAETTLDNAVARTTPSVAETVAGKTDDSSKPAPGQIDQNTLLAAPVPQWIWTDESKDNQKVWFRRSFELADSPKSAVLYADCDNHIEVYVNGTKIGKSDEWKEPVQADVVKTLQSGRNEIAILGRNDGGIAAMIAKIAITTENGTSVNVATDKTWRVSETEVANWNGAGLDDSDWKKATVSFPIGKGPWGVPGFESASGGDGRDPLNAKNIIAPPGFVVQRVYQLAKDQGSWVAMAIDPQGRIYACDQGDAGLYRMTIQSGDEKISEQVTVEKVTINGTPRLSGAQGLVWAFDSLWFHQSGGHLLRLTDSNGDDRLDTAQSYPGTTAGGEHGNHAVIQTEDGQGLYLDSGNHSPLAETVGSHVPTWYEGLLLPRMWDANGHARGMLAPGGWVTRVDIEDQTQTLYSIGYRNQYDLALNRFGDMFTYDADMEWDMGLPWYRPTRICHVVSGSDYGWRSGSGKWPTYYEDSLPPTVEIGPGSPTGIVAGIGTQFPTADQDALFALDWTFGTIYKIALTPVGAGYVGQAEPFVYSVPLPVTDAVVGADGSLIFAVGGRGTESAVFRVRYVGDASTDTPTKPEMNDEDTQDQNVIARSQRRQLEAFHGVANPVAIDAAWPFMASQDRFLRYAARIAVESQPVDAWSKLVLTSTIPQTVITGAVALARMGDESHAEPIMDRLLKLNTEELNDSQVLGLLRAYALTFLELAKPSETHRQQIIAQLDPMLPSSNRDVNVELVRVLISLRHPGVVAKAMELIQNRGKPAAPDWSIVAARSSQYGGSIERLISNPPPTEAIAYAFMLRNMREGWTSSLRREYFTFLNEAARAAGGASYGGYLTRIRDEALGNAPGDARKELEDITGEDFNPVPDFEIKPIVGPGQAWTVSSARGAIQGKPNFENGRSLYFSTQCASCHRMAGLGGNIGPDLTSVRNKFDDNYVLEAIVEPSKVISDQYGSSTVLLADGTLLTGLITPQPDGNFSVYPNQAVGTSKPIEPIEINADDIEEISESKVSQMPKELLNGLNADEMRDLIAYLMSGGNPEDGRYK